MTDEPKRKRPDLSKRSPEERVSQRQRKSGREVARAELCREVLRRRVSQGLTYEQIGGELSISYMAAYRAYREAIRNIPESLAAEARKESLEHLDYIRREALRRIKSDPPTYLAILLKVEQRRARLLGLDLTRSVEVNVAPSMLDLLRAAADDEARRADRERAAARRRDAGAGAGAN